jgi:hypothetical protein
MKNTLKLVSLVASLTLSGSAFADWSAVTGETVGEGNNVIHAQAGLPTISGKWFHGMSEKFDLGAGLSFDYLYAGTFTPGFGFTPGFRPAAIMKFGLMQQDKFSMALRIEPGVNLYFSGAGVLFGLGVPVGLDMGIRINDKVSIPLGVELAMSLNLTQAVIFVLPIKIGGGVEWKFSETMALTGRMNFGPAIVAGNFGFGFGGVGFAYDALIGMEFKL